MVGPKLAKLELQIMDTLRTRRGLYHPRDSGGFSRESQTGLHDHPDNRVSPRSKESCAPGEKGRGSFHVFEAAASVTPHSAS